MLDRRLAILISLTLVLGSPACSDDPVTPTDDCALSPLPLSGQANGPVLTDVALEVQEGEGIVVLATATDPQGSQDLIDIEQAIGVFRDEGCEGTTIVVRDDLAGSGLEESFGTAVDAVSEADLFQRIADTQAWPVEVEFRDAQGNVTSGRVAARVVR